MNDAARTIEILIRLGSNLRANRNFLNRIVGGYCLRLPERLDGVAKLRGQLLGLARGHSFGVDWLASGERQFAGVQMPGMNREQIVDPAQSERNQRDLGANGQIGRA